MLEVLPAPLHTRSKRDDPASQKIRDHAAKLFAWRHHSGFGRLEASVLVLYCAVLALLIPAHEAWSDEAQAWLLARGNSAWELIRHRLHYEGAPALWHLLIKVFQGAHGTYSGFGWFAAAFSIAGVYVFLRWSPFPAIIRVLLPFTYFIQYQYAVVARSYNLFPVLTFGLCALFLRRKYVVAFAVVAGFLANLSMQGIVFASALCALYAFDLWRAHRNGFPLERRPIIAAAAVYVVMAGVACYSAIPAPDVNFAVSETVSTGPAHNLLVRVVGVTKPVFTTPPLPGPHLPPVPDPPEPAFLSSPSGWAAWQFNHQPASPAKAVEEFALSMATQAAWAVSTSNLLATAFVAVMIVWLRKRKELRMLLPWCVLLLVGEVVWVSDHHLGMVFVVMIAALWVAAQAKPYASASPKVEVAFTSLFALMLLFQVGWTWNTSRKELQGNYDPGKATAKFLNEHPVAKTAAFNYWAESVQPYFDHNPFYNIPTRYRIWSWGTNPDPYYKEALEQHPDRIVYSAEFPGPGVMRNQWLPLVHVPTARETQALAWDEAVAYFREVGYVETHRFCGRRFARSSYSYMDCDLIFEPVATHGSSLAAAEYPGSK